MPYTKNIAFTSLIKINGRLREFNFRKRNEVLYDGDTNDERGERHFFKIEKIDGQWILIGTNLPSWLTQNDSSIIQAIVKQHGENIGQPGVTK